MRTKLGCLALLVLLATGTAVEAQDVTVNHTGTAPVSLDAARLAALPAIELTITYGAPPAPHVFHGPLLWTILTASGAADPARHSDAVHQVLYVTGVDNYVAVIAAGELSPEFEAKQAILALMQDGKPLARPRVVVPGDKRGGRGVHDVVRLRLEDLPKSPP